MSSRLVGALRAWARSFTPARFPYGRFCLALVIGSFGGWIFASLKLPLPWMLGSMAACTLAALVRAPIAAPGAVRPPMTMIIGVMLGAGFSPRILESIGAWLPTMLGMVVFVVISGAACATYFRRVAAFDVPTAFFAGMPGGLLEMTIVAESRGGDVRTIALIHSARILLVVLALPFLIQLISGTALGARPVPGVSIADTPWTDQAWLLGTAGAGALAGYLLRLPAGGLLGPMLVSAAIHVAGWTHFMPPTELVNMAQLVLGTAVGCRFAGTTPRTIIRILALSVGSTAILLTATLAMAIGVSQISSYDVLTLVLAYSPGGLTEMSLVAVSLGIETAFIAAHHVVRVFLVMMGAAPAFALMRR